MAELQKVFNVIFHDAVLVAGNGNVFAPQKGNYDVSFEISGTSTSRKILFELAGPSGVYRPYTAFNANDPTLFLTETTNGNDAAPESWQAEVPAGFSFRARLETPAGGNVTVKGAAVLKD